MSLISRGFRGRRQEPDEGGRLPPGQYLTDGFPVLSAGPTPHTSLDMWTFSARAARLAGAPRRPARRHPPDGRGRVPGGARVLDRLRAR